MPRPTRAQGRPTTSVVPPTWGRDHAGVTAQARNAAVTLRRPDTTTWDEAARATIPVPGATYAVAVTATIQALTSNAADPITGEEQVTAPAYIVAVDSALAPLDGDEIDVVICLGDEALEGRTFRIDRVGYGTDRAERDLYATLTDLPAA